MEYDVVYAAEIEKLGVMAAISGWLLQTTRAKYLPVSL
jgi:hypothetical protein